MNANSSERIAREITDRWALCQALGDSGEMYPCPGDEDDQRSELVKILDAELAAERLAAEKCIEVLKKCFVVGSDGRVEWPDESGAEALALAAAQALAAYDAAKGAE